MAAVSAACIVPPLVTSFAVIVGKKYFSQEDHDAGIVNIILGCTHITEGAIPFMTKNIWPVMPIMMLSAAIASVLTLLLGVHVPAPHGGFLVLPVVDGGIQWVLAILAGTVVGGILFTVFKKHEWARAQQASEASQAVPAAVERPDVSPEPSDAPAPSADPASEPAEVKDFVSADNVFLGLDLAGRDGAPVSYTHPQGVWSCTPDDLDAVRLVRVDLTSWAGNWLSLIHISCPPSPLHPSPRRTPRASCARSCST